MGRACRRRKAGHGCTEFRGVIAISVLQTLADHLLPDELQNWCARCVFGNGKGALSTSRERRVIGILRFNVDLYDTIMVDFVHRDTTLLAGSLPDSHNFPCSGFYQLRLI
jgi:hypothetical protein